MADTGTKAAAFAGADFSPCGRYRYRLWRQRVELAPLRRVLFVMLNPSTADAVADDATIRKCRGFSERWGFERFDVANLFAWRATDPMLLRLEQLDGQDIVGPDNAVWLAQLAAKATKVVVAWGANAKLWAPYARKTCELLLANNLRGQLFCLGTTADGQPCHPVRLAYSTELVTFTAVRDG